jgi:hypothetical protein
MKRSGLLRFQGCVRSFGLSTELAVRANPKQKPRPSWRGTPAITNLFAFIRSLHESISRGILRGCYWSVKTRTISIRSSDWRGASDLSIKNGNDSPREKLYPLLPPARDL